MIPLPPPWTLSAAEEVNVAFTGNLPSRSILLRLDVQNNMLMDPEEQRVNWIYW